jgi:hypothetical protein
MALYFTTPSIRNSVGGTIVFFAASFHILHTHLKRIISRKGRKLKMIATSSPLNLSAVIILAVDFASFILPEDSSKVTKKNRQLEKREGKGGVELLTFFS